MKAPGIKQFLFALPFIVLLLPFLQQQLSIYTSKPLTGEFIPAEKIAFSAASWFEGDFQNAYDKYYEENIGFRNPLIRLYNQVDFSLFNVAHGGDIVVGKKGYLFQTQYLTAHAGKDFIGEKEINKRMEHIKFVNSRLKEFGVTLIVAFAPTKADFFEEYIPSYFEQNGSAPTNYNSYRKKLLETNVSFIDFNDYFLKLKKASPYPLFPKQGIHWSQYGMYLAVDSLLKFIEARKGIDLNDLYCDGFDESYELKSTDYDLGDLCNVISNMSHYEMTYPILRFENNPLKRKPNVLTIGDSFNWNIINSGVPGNIFSGSNFWYYNHDVYADWLPQKKIINLSTFMDEVKRQDVVIVLQTESNLNNIGLGFFEATFDMLKDNISVSPIARMENEIRNNPEWLESIKKKAAEKNVSIDEMIRSDAQWMAEHDTSGQ